MKYFFFLVYCFCTCSVFAQLTCRAVLLDSVSRQPIEFANVGVLGKGLGTVTNEKGEFVLQIPDSLKDAVVKLSMIGYRTKSFLGTSLQNKTKILLAPEAYNLKEVVVKPRKNKIKILGNETQTHTVSGGFKNNNLGAEIGVRLNIKHPNTQLRKFMININSNTLSQHPIFRLNVYDVGKDGMPKDNLLKQNILIEPKERQGFVEFDLKPYLIFSDEDVFVTIEWIKDLGDATGLYFSTKLIGSATYFRQTSQAKWDKAPVGVGLHVEVGY